ncbi:hypothetical protein LWM68_23505 [Niabella sp. W65]|nr:hypothetical protein [Niabella sp. W65]MCH7365479.1 hypothetical protein [Niabella sp. W65]ULT41267.1 hypothetical protein KRR40_42390 [Niabella sp. I65]
MTYYYSLQLLTDAGSCVTLSKMAQKQLRKLSIQKNELEYQRDTYLLTLRDIARQIAETEALLKGLDEALAGLPDGKLKDEYIDKRVRAVYANFELNRRRKQYPGTIIGKRVDPGAHTQGL